MFCVFIVSLAVRLVVKTMDRLPLQLAVVLTCSNFAMAAAPADLKIEAQPGDQVRVEVVLSAEGQLHSHDDQGKLQKTPISVDGQFGYTEHLVHPTKHGRETLRQYSKAHAKITVAGEESTTQLAPEHRILAVRPTAETVTIYSPRGPLTRDSLELVNTPGNTALLDQLLPTEKVDVGFKYSPTAETMARLLTIDAAQSSTVECEVVSLTERLAIIKFAGDVEGAIQGVSTKIEIEGQLRFNPAVGQLMAAQLTLAEKRSITHVAPGFDMQASVKIRLTPVNRLANSSRRQLRRLQPSEAEQLIDFNSPHLELRLLHDRNWHFTSQRRLGAVMRRVDAGELVAQCNISRLPPSDEDTEVALESFRLHVQEAVGKQQGTIGEASTATTDHGNQVLRIEASGSVDDLPVTWIYYHVTAADGRRAVLVFTLETSQLERFNGSDHQIVGNLRFSPIEQANSEGDAESETAEPRAARAIVYPRRPLRSR